MYMPTQRQERTPPALMDTTKITLAGPMMAGDGPSCVGGSSYQPNMKRFVDVCRRKFRSQTSDNMDRWKSRGGKRQREEKKRGSEKRKSQRKEDAGARKGRKVAKHCVFPLICVSGGSKRKLAKAAGAEPSGQMRDVKLHAVVARSTFRIKSVKE